MHIEPTSSPDNLVGKYILNQRQEIIDMNEKVAAVPTYSDKDNVSHIEDVHLVDYQQFHEKAPQDRFNADVDNNSEHL